MHTCTMRAASGERAVARCVASGGHGARRQHNDELNYIRVDQSEAVGGSPGDV
jgi:hypothetical protein